MFGLELPKTSLNDFWSLLRASPSFLGCSITYPHKQAAYQAVDKKTPRANRLGSLNTIKRCPDGTLIGEATDGIALCLAIEKAKTTIQGNSATILGAGGGAGIAIVDELCVKGINQLNIIETHSKRLQSLLAFTKKYWPEVKIEISMQPAKIIINATPRGKSSKDPKLIPDELVRKSELVCDIATSRKNTQLVQTAMKNKVATITGREMGAMQLEAQLRHIGIFDQQK